jgi:hypothetical protein
MTFKELANQINQLTPEQQDMDVTVHVAALDEYFPESGTLEFADENCDVLDEGQLFLQI